MERLYATSSESQPSSGQQSISGHIHHSLTHPNQPNVHFFLNLSFIDGKKQTTLGWLTVMGKQSNLFLEAGEGLGHLYYN